MTIPVPLNNVNSIFGYKDRICLCTDAGISLLGFDDGNYSMESHWTEAGVMGGCAVPGKGMVLCTPSGLYLYEETIAGGGTHSDHC